MFKIILICLVVIGAIISIPALHERAGVMLAPVEKKLAPHMTFATDPMKKVRTSDKETNILGMLKQEHLQGRKTPEPDEFPQWLKEHAIEPDGWGNRYFMFQKNDSIFIGSNGPDGKKGTPDDFTTGMNW
jgi:hypothetical protein